MLKIRAVIDANILVSGIISPKGAPRWGYRNLDRDEYMGSVPGFFLNYASILADEEAGVTA